MSVSSQQSHPGKPRRGTRRQNRRQWSGSAWLLSHRRALQASLRKLYHTPLGSLMTVLVIAIALALPTAALVALENGRLLVTDWEGGSQISVYLARHLPEAAIDDVIARVEAQPQVREVSYLSPDMALAEFGRDAGFADALALLEDNPLPPVLVVQLMRSMDGSEQLQQLHDRISAYAEVERVDIDMEWIRRLALLIDAIQRAGLALSVLIALGVVLIIGNTIRLDILNQQNEILIIKRVGGTNAFIRRPFLYSGVCYGLGGSLVAWILVSAGLAVVNTPVRDLAQSFQSAFLLRGLGLAGGMVLMVCGAFLGLSGAWLSVTRHLHRIEPK